MDDDSKSETKDLFTVLDIFRLNQLVQSATHIGGHILDIVATDSVNISCDSVEVIKTATTSDHYLVKFAIKCASNMDDNGPPRRIMRKLRSVDISEFRSDISATLDTVDFSSLNSASQDIDRRLKQALDVHAPLIQFKPRTRTSAPWMNSCILNGRRLRRHLEEVYKKTNLQCDKNAYFHQVYKVNDSIKHAKQEFFTAKVNSVCSGQRELFSVFSHLTHNDNITVLPDIPVKELPDKFATYFSEKIENIRQSLDSSTSITPASQHAEHSPCQNLDCFTATSESEVSQILKNTAIKTCILDPIPRQLLAQILDCMIPTFVKIINLSFTLGTFPEEMKQAIIKPLIKKPSLNCNVFKNYRPVSNLSFLSKLLERVAASRLHSHFRENNLYTKNQSAYRSGHSVETALLSITDSALRILDSNKSVIVILLDLSAAFDTIDHQILFHQLESRCHIRKNALNWIRSYLTDRTYSVMVQSSQSSPRTLKYGVPQGSVLGPFLYTAYTAPLAQLLEAHGVFYHFYADDTQLWLPVDLDNQADLKECISKLESCVLDVQEWMSGHKLKLNSEKTEVLVVHSKSRVATTPTITLHFGDVVVHSTKSARNLGVKFDSTLSFSNHITNVCINGYRYLRNIKAAGKYLPRDSLLGLIHAFVTSRIDFCNSLLYGLPDYLLSHLQKLQNQAARLATGTERFEHITPALASLHWLPVKLRIEFKILIFVHKFLYHGNCPDYFDLQKLEPERVTRSAIAPKLYPTRSYHVRTGDRAFSVDGPALWNDLPAELRNISDFNKFKVALKTYLYKNHFKL